MRTGAPSAALITTALTAVACGRPTDGPTAPAQWADVGRVCRPWSPATSLPAPARESLPPRSPDDTTRVEWQWAEPARRLSGGFGWRRSACRAIS